VERRQDVVFMFIFGRVIGGERTIRARAATHRRFNGKIHKAFQNGGRTRKAFKSFAGRRGAGDFGLALAVIAKAPWFFKMPFAVNLPKASRACAGEETSKEMARVFSPSFSIKVFFGQPVLGHRQGYARRDDRHVFRRWRWHGQADFSNSQVTASQASSISAQLGRSS